MPHGGNIGPPFGYNLGYNNSMATAVKVTTVGNSVGIVLPREVLDKLRVEKGDTLFLTDTPDGVRLTPYTADLATKLEVAERIMRENREVLRKLAE
jgi:putative addiction module antidote